MTPTIGVRTRSKVRSNLVELSRYPSYTLMIEPKNHKEALKDELWVRAI